MSRGPQTSHPLGEVIGQDWLPVKTHQQRAVELEGLDRPLAVDNLRGVKLGMINRAFGFLHGKPGLQGRDAEVGVGQHLGPGGHLFLDRHARLGVGPGPVAANRLLEKGQQLRVKLAKYQGPLGVTAIVLAIAFTVLTLIK